MVEKAGLFLHRTEHQKATLKEKVKTAKYVGEIKSYFCWKLFSLPGRPEKLNLFSHFPVRFKKSERQRTME